MEKWRIREGMTVRSSDGEKVGKIVICNADDFVIESGFIFSKDYSLRYDAVAGIEGDEVRLAYTLDQVKHRDFPAVTGSVAGASTIRDAGADADLLSSRYTSEGQIDTSMSTSAGTTTSAGASSLGTTTSTGASSLGTRAAEHLEARGSDLPRTGEDIRIPVSEEEVSAEKALREAGEVRVHKTVVTETRHFTVNVAHEEVDVERVPVERQAAPGEANFVEETITVPLMEEEVEIRKRPVVREEVRIHKRVEEEELPADTTVRREAVSVEEEGERVDVTDDETFVPPPKGKKPLGKGDTVRP